MRKQIKVEILDYPIVKTLENICYRGHIVPKGFITDGATIPQLFHFLLPPYCSYGRAAILHDFLYRNPQFNRKEADLIFRQYMKELGVHSWKTFVIFWIVRIFGGISRRAGLPRRLSQHLSKQL